MRSGWDMKSVIRSSMLLGSRTNVGNVTFERSIPTLQVLLSIRLKAEQITQDANLSWEIRDVIIDPSFSSLHSASISKKDILAHNGCKDEQDGGVVWLRVWRRLVFPINRASRLHDPVKRGTSLVPKAQHGIKNCESKYFSTAELRKETLASDLAMEIDVIPRSRRVITRILFWLTSSASVCHLGRKHRMPHAPFSLSSSEISSVLHTRSHPPSVPEQVPLRAPFRVHLQWRKWSIFHFCLHDLTKSIRMQQATWRLHTRSSNPVDIVFYRQREGIIDNGSDIGYI